VAVDSNRRLLDTLPFPFIITIELFCDTVPSRLAGSIVAVVTVVSFNR
jgi:hypothetical protein